MKDIKKYSSDFATKLMYLISTQEDSCKKSLVDQACDYTDEKETTVRNWLFNGKVPRVTKRLDIADAVGVSVDYLFNDSVSVKAIEKPKIYKEDGCYLVPFLSESEVFKVKKNLLLPVVKRIPIMLPSFDKIVAFYGDNIYATQVCKSNFEPYIENDSTILFTNNLKLEEYKFILLQINQSVEFRRLLKSDKGYQLMHFDQSGNEVIEPISSNEKYLLVIFAFFV